MHREDGLTGNYTIGLGAATYDPGPHYFTTEELPESSRLHGWYTLSVLVFMDEVIGQFPANVQVFKRRVSYRRKLRQVLKTLPGVQWYMGDTLDYTTEEAELEEAIYETPEASKRRCRVRQELDLKPGEKVISIGCGPGFEPAEIAAEVGPIGIVRAIDRSEPMCNLARSRCSEYPHAEVVEGDAADLPFADNSFDAATVVQVYEYVENVKRAVAELYRVLQPGGRAIVYDTDFDSLVWKSTDTERQQRILASLGEHCPRPRLGSEVAPILRDAGLTVERIKPHTILNTRLDENTFAYQLMRSHRKYILKHGIVDAEEANGWRDDLVKLDKAGGTFFSLTQYLYRVRKPVEKDHQLDS